MRLQKWGEWKVDVIPIVIEAFRTVTNRLEKWIKKDQVWPGSGDDREMVF